jgi:Phage integrase family
MGRKYPKYVNAYSNKQRANQSVRYVFRRKGQKSIVLPGPYLSEDFNAAYAAALGAVPQTIGAGRTRPGTIDALAVSFYKSTAWTGMTPASHTSYRPIIERLRAKDGTKRVALLRPEHIAIMLDQVASPSAKKKLLEVLRMLMTAAIPALRKDDPTAGIKVKLPKSKGWHSWTDDEIERYRAHHPLGTAARLVLEFALETTSRRMEVARLGPQHVRGGRIKIERCHRSRDVDIKITPTLAAAIGAMPAVGITTFIVGKRGHALTPDALAKEFVKWATAAGLPARCRLHGLKKAGMRTIAEKGASTHELQSVSGHKTLAMIQHYTDAVDRVKLADSAFEKITKTR